MINDEKHLREYLRNFFKAYHIKSDNLTELNLWCQTYLGKKYLDWNLWKRSYSHESYHDEITIIYIREHKKCTLFELRWSELIIQVVDKGHF